MILSGPLQNLENHLAHRRKSVFELNYRCPVRWWAVGGGRVVGQQMFDVTSTFTSAGSARFPRYRHRRHHPTAKQNHPQPLQQAGWAAGKYIDGKGRPVMSVARVASKCGNWPRSKKFAGHASPHSHRHVGSGVLSFRLRLGGHDHHYSSAPGEAYLSSQATLAMGLGEMTGWPSRFGAYPCFQLHRCPTLTWTQHPSQTRQQLLLGLWSLFRDHHQLSRPANPRHLSTNPRQRYHFGPGRMRRVVIKRHL